ncbi:PocR ligand-binding domain-containing protein [Peptoniphilus indolicus]|uniref:Predicted sensor domain n=3 Tax=Peptoniphilus indolicus TaxID=33030 RepID=A0A379DCD8_9FIRM|nr:PocR ligand-binding domain-containing protein [Peptoniphilus indolicus]SUB75539.1 Predicted sensor domain [Peptoniphilus indolicus]
MNTDNVSKDLLCNMNIQNQIDDKYTENIKDLDIISIFGKDYLEQLQRIISDVTGLAIVIVDYKGEPVTSMTNFSKKCKKLRKHKMAEMICKLSDASGAIRAAVTHKTSIYFCPFGRLEVAIPIVIKGHYLGAFLGGQVCCNDAPDNVYKMEEFLLEQSVLDEIRDLEYEEDRVYSYSEFVSVVKLIEFIILEIIKKELISGYHENKNKSKIRELENKLEIMIKKNNEIDSKLKIVTNTVNKFFILKVIDSISNLLLIEDRTILSEYISYLNEYLNYALDDSPKTIYKTIKAIESYFEIRKIEYGERLNYRIEVNEEVQNFIMPYRILIPYMYKLSVIGLSLGNKNYNISLDINKDGEDIKIVIKDNRSINDDKNVVVNGERKDISILDEHLKYLNEKMIIEFGKQYSTNYSESSNGTTVCIKFPIQKLQDKL